MLLDVSFVLFRFLLHELNHVLQTELARCSSGSFKPTTALLLILLMNGLVLYPRFPSLAGTCRI